MRKYRIQLHKDSDYITEIGYLTEILLDLGFDLDFKPYSVIILPTDLKRPW